MTGGVAWFFAPQLQHWRGRQSRHERRVAEYAMICVPHKDAQQRHGIKHPRCSNTHDLNSQGKKWRQPEKQRNSIQRFCNDHLLCTPLLVHPREAHAAHTPTIILSVYCCKFLGRKIIHLIRRINHGSDVFRVISAVGHMQPPQPGVYIAGYNPLGCVAFMYQAAAPHTYVCSLMSFFFRCSRRVQM